ncbi:unnamed protein product [Cyclocybe aegerita]|uniref:Uncharacterized protein n=1 Tax=Cyclocybe aegerita TaxID=1973307 RepID=A0A8S0WEG1_CYCAE|nr:unnamed protein product [Cyclocybe aegerita]
MWVTRLLLPSVELCCVSSPQQPIAMRPHGPAIFTTDSLSLRSFRVDKHPPHPPSLKASSLRSKASATNPFAALLRGRTTTAKYQEPTLKDLEGEDEEFLQMGVLPDLPKMPAQTKMLATAGPTPPVADPPRTKPRTGLIRMFTKLKPRSSPSTSPSPSRGRGARSPARPPPSPNANAAMKEQREAALRARGLLPPLRPNKDLSQQEAEQDAHIPVVALPSLPYGQRGESASESSHEGGNVNVVVQESAADMIKREWEARNKSLERERMSKFRFGGSAPSSPAPDAVGFPMSSAPSTSPSPENAPRPLPPPPSIPLPSPPTSSLPTPPLSPVFHTAPTSPLSPSLRPLPLAPAPLMIDAALAAGTLPHFQVHSEAQAQAHPEALSEPRDREPEPYMFPLPPSPSPSRRDEDGGDGFFPSVRLVSSEGRDSVDDAGVDAGAAVNGDAEAFGGGGKGEASGGGDSEANVLSTSVPVVVPSVVLHSPQDSLVLAPTTTTAEANASVVEVLPEPHFPTQTVEVVQEIELPPPPEDVSVSATPSGACTPRPEHLHGLSPSHTPTQAQTPTPTDATDAVREAWAAASAIPTPTTATPTTAGAGGVSSPPPAGILKEGEDVVVVDGVVDEDKDKVEVGVKESEAEREGQDKDARDPAINTSTIASTSAAEAEDVIPPSASEPALSSSASLSQSISASASQLTSPSASASAAAFHARTDSFAALEETISGSSLVAPSLSFDSSTDASASTSDSTSSLASAPSSSLPPSSLRSSSLPCSTNTDASSAGSTTVSAPTPHVKPIGIGKLGGLVVKTHEGGVVPVIVESPVVEGYRFVVQEGLEAVVEVEEDAPGAVGVGVEEKKIEEKVEKVERAEGLASVAEEEDDEKKEAEEKDKITDPRPSTDTGASLSVSSAGTHAPMVESVSASMPPLALASSAATPSSPTKTTASAPNPSSSSSAQGHVHPPQAGRAPKRGVTDPVGMLEKAEKRKSMNPFSFKRGQSQYVKGAGGGGGVGAGVGAGGGEEGASEGARQGARGPAERLGSKKLSLSNMRRSVIGTLSRPKNTTSSTASSDPSSDANPTRGRLFDASHLPTSPTLPSSFRSAMTTGMTSRTYAHPHPPRSPTLSPPPPVQRRAVSPVMYNRGSILMETSAIEDEESRQLTEMAFLG